MRDETMFRKKGPLMTVASAQAPTLGIIRLEHAKGLELPAYETTGSAGMDLRAAVAEDRQIVLLPGRRTLVPTGLIFEIPEGFEVQIRPRSGLAFRFFSSIWAMTISASNAVCVLHRLFSHQSSSRRLKSAPK